MNTLIEVDRGIAETIFGARVDRPTISRRAGEIIGPLLGVSAATGTDLFHIGLVLGALYLANRR